MLQNSENRALGIFGRIRYGWSNCKEKSILQPAKAYEKENIHLEKNYNFSM